VLCIIIFVGRVTRGEGEKTGINKEKELFAAMVNLFPQVLRDAYFTTVLEQLRVQV
jgi:hypothetical protein